MLVLVSTVKIYGFGFFWHYEVGGNYFNMPSIYEKLLSKGFNKPDNIFINTGTSWYFVFKRVVLGWENSTLNSETFHSQSERETAIISGKYSLVNLGHLLFSNQRFNIYANIGIGKSLTEIFVFQDFSGGFDTLFNDPPKSVSLYMDGLAIGGNFQVDMSLYGFNIGAKVGYIHTVYGQWKVWDKTVPGGPNEGIRGAYIKLLIGGGVLL